MYTYTISGVKMRKKYFYMNLSLVVDWIVFVTFALAFIYFLKVISRGCSCKSVALNKVMLLR